MFQSFTAEGGPDAGRAALPLLRAELAARGLDGFYIPHEDEWLNEYLPACAERLAFATGFTGSAGAAVVLADKAALFADGRYTLQAQTQVDTGLFEIVDLVEVGVAAWLREHLTAGLTVGYDPRLSSPDSLAKLTDAAEAVGARLVAVGTNPVDAVWTDRPAPPRARITPQPEVFSGESAADKRARIGKAIADAGADLAVLTSPASLAWLLNIRGGDVPRTPLPLGAALAHADGTVDLFIAPEKVDDVARAWLGNTVALHDEDAFGPALAGLGGKTALADPASAAVSVFTALDAAGAAVKRAPDPCILPRACKNEVEIEGARRAHLRDGAAVSRFLAWFDAEAPKGKLTEIDAARALEAFRRDTGELVDLSFDSISGAGPNGAIVHYRVTEPTNRGIAPGDLFLIDSGGQYRDGTTDITRTIVVGTPSDEMRDRFTRVLKGHIALSAVRFPKGTTGHQLDVLARMALWQAGLDYDHGTGHGVGSFLSVHEGPQRVARVANGQALLPGMILSNEPGYYKTGGYGIRIENLQVVTAPADVPGGERQMMGFETLTYAPIDRRLVDPALLTEAELAWFNAYHAAVRAKLADRLSGADLDWLIAATAPV
jgi:Xaa-Pro aminopeptidase